MRRAARAAHIMDIAAHNGTTTQLAVGIMNSRYKRHFERRMILQTWATMLPESQLVIRFVQRCTQSTPSVVCVDVEDEHPKAIAWFQRALVLFPSAQWICHSDDDVYMQARQVHFELSKLTPRAEVYGLINIMKPWEASGPYKHQFHGILEQFKRPNVEIQGGKYPFMQGGFYAMTRDLVEMLIPDALSLWQRFQQPILKFKMGEDAMMFNALHLAAKRQKASYTLRHVTWTRSHYLPARPRHDKRGGMGWVFPSTATTVVHWLKSGRLVHWNLVHNATGSTSRPAFPAFRFDWDAGAERFTMDARSLARWQAYVNICGIWGCHAPYRGGDLAEFVRVDAKISAAGQQLQAEGRRR